MVVQVTLEKERISPVVLTCQEVLIGAPSSERLRMLGQGHSVGAIGAEWQEWLLVAGLRKML